MPVVAVADHHQQATLAGWPGPANGIPQVLLRFWGYGDRRGRPDAGSAHRSRLRPAAHCAAALAELVQRRDGHRPAAGRGRWCPHPPRAGSAAARRGLPVAVPQRRRVHRGRRGVQRPRAGPVAGAPSAAAGARGTAQPAVDGTRAGVPAAVPAGDGLVLAPYRRPGGPVLVRTHCRAGRRRLPGRASTPGASSAARGAHRGETGAAPSVTAGQAFGGAEGGQASALGLRQRVSCRQSRGNPISATDLDGSPTNDSSINERTFAAHVVPGDVTCKRNAMSVSAPYGRSLWPSGREYSSSIVRNPVVLTGVNERFHTRAWCAQVFRSTVSCSNQRASECSFFALNR